MTTTSVPAHEKLPFRDPGLPLAARVEDLLERLTADERVAMLHQYAPAVPRLGLASFRTGTEALHGVAWLGAATTFPQAVGLGATWDEVLVHEVATAVSVEQRAFHHHRPPAVGSGTNSLQAWAPVVNLLRDPRWGRNEEGYSEDPLHSARLGDAFCRGMSGDDPEHLRTAPILKHFLAYNNEDDRYRTSSGLRPRVLHEYDLAPFRAAIASGSATGVMAAYNLVNGRPCHVSPLIESELRRWARPTGHELFVVSDAEAPSNLVDVEHYFDDHAVSHAAALKAGIDSFTDHGEDSGTVVGRLREALRRGLIDGEDVTRAVRRQLALRFRLGEFDPEHDPYAGTPWEVVDSPGHRALALRAATESVVLLKNAGGTLPLDPAAGRGRRLAVIGPLAETLCEDWYSGTMPYRVTVADGLATALAGRGGEVVTVEGVDRVALRSASTGALLAVPEGGPDGPLAAAGPAVDPADASATPAGAVPDTAAFDVFDWGGGVLTLRNAGTGRYVGLVDADRSLAADRQQPGGWDVHETFRLEGLPDGTMVLRNEYNGRYAVLDPRTGRVAVTATDPEQAERWHREVVRDGIAEAVAAARWADTAVVVLGNDPHINGRETQDRATTRLPDGQEALLRAVGHARPRTVALLMSSYPYAVDWADAHLPAVVWTSHGGQETGRAVAAVLLGDAEPSGRLPQTWYRGDDPLPHPLDYDIIKSGWTYQYHRARPLYPFGHGLSYTDFGYEDLRLTAAAVPQDGEVGVRVTVACTGERPGAETVQLYVRATGAARYQAPLLKLAGFAKARLRPGERADLVFMLPAEALAHWDVATGAFTVDPGDYEILVGRSAGEILLTAPLRVTGPEPRPREAVGRRLLAADFDDYTDLCLLDAALDHGDAVGPAGERGSAEYRTVDLTGARAVRAEVSRQEPGSARLEFWRGAPGDAGAVLLADVEVPSTGHRYAMTAVSAELAQVQSGVGDLHVVLTGEQRLAAFTLER